MWWNIIQSFLLILGSIWVMIVGLAVLPIIKDAAAPTESLGRILWAWELTTLIIGLALAGYGLYTIYRHALLEGKPKNPEDKS